jgi:hypothetical protein
MKRKLSKFCIFLVIIFLALFIFFAIQKSPKIIDESRIKVVDNIGKNYLIRGSNPFVNKLGDKNFSYHDLKKQINLAINKMDETELDDFYLIDINLLNLDGYFQILDEELFFKKNPQLGTFKQFSEISPALILIGFSDNKFIEEITNKYHQNLDKILQEIHQNLEIQKNKPVIIYIHCNAGRDRTGLIVASYRMKYLQQNISQALLANITDVGRNPEYFLYSAVFSYCNYLKKQMSLPDEYCRDN